MKKQHCIVLFCLFLVFFLSRTLYAQQARISEEIRTLDTYAYGDPSPIPVLTKAKSSKIYPYHVFDAYSSQSVQKRWKVIKLENDYIEVYVLPEIGGKVWGAVEKSTGHEFIYKNEVVKFRNISLRGPWASGGIEFNFGVIGHSPSTASPVDYQIRRNDDGSVSCIVGDMDLPSRTHWAVEIRLEQDKAFFETHATWYNTGPVAQSYYNWMTAAAEATEDLTFIFPGDAYLEHNGKAAPWPIDEKGRDLSRYVNNAFGSHKSYHILGSNNLMGGYYEQRRFGFGHWALADEMPGRKLWIWSLGRDGGIWEDLLTDHDGQYIEFQAGRLLNQYTPGSFDGPVRQAAFAPGVTDTWTDIWFPVKAIGGMKEVSRQGILNVREHSDSLEIGLNALAFAETDVVVISGGREIHRDRVTLRPMDVYQSTIPFQSDQPYQVIVEGMALCYDSGSPVSKLSRPFTDVSNPGNLASASRTFYAGKDHLAFRELEKAKDNFKKAVQLDSFYVDALAELAGVYYRCGQYDSAWVYLHKALLLNTYHPAANFYAGHVYRAKNDPVNAQESFGWAARSPEYSAGAYTQMAELSLGGGRPDLALHYARRALDHNRHHIGALQLIAVCHRQSGKEAAAASILDSLQAIYPLSHFAAYERSLSGNDTVGMTGFSGSIRNEFPYQTLLELSISYQLMGDTTQAIRVLGQVNSPQPEMALWKAYLREDTGALEEISLLAPDYVFPYRREMIAALEWATAHHKHWKFGYYLALNYWACARQEESAARLTALGEIPDYAPFYLTRAALPARDSHAVLADLLRANQLDPDDWRTGYLLIQQYEYMGNDSSALRTSAAYHTQFPENSSLTLLYARQLISAHRYDDCIGLLKHTTVLPFEGADQGREIYWEALIRHAMQLFGQKKYTRALAKINASREWPEHLGVGKPLDDGLDERMEDWLAYQTCLKLGMTAEANRYLTNVLDYPYHARRTNHPNKLISALALRASGKEAEGDALLHDWQTAQPGSAIVPWLTAVYRGEDTEMPPDLKENDRYRIWSQFIPLFPLFTN